MSNDRLAASLDKLFDILPELRGVSDHDEIVRIVNRANLSDIDVDEVANIANKLVNDSLIDTILANEPVTKDIEINTALFLEGRLPGFIDKLGGVAKAFSLVNWEKLNAQERLLAVDNMSRADNAKAQLDKSQALAYRSLSIKLMTRQLAIINGNLHGKGYDGHWTNFGVISKGTLLPVLMSLFQIVLPYTSNHGSLKDWAEESYASLLRLQIDMTSIQFEDCALLKDGSVVDSCNEVPRVTIEKPVREAIETGKPTVYVKELQEFLDEALPNKKIQDRFLDRLAMTLVLDPDKKQSLARACMLYGPTAQNGKSLMISVLTRALTVRDGKQIYKSFNLSKFEGYDVASLIDSILLVNDDGTGEFIESKVSTNIKIAITAGALTVRQIYREPVTIVPTVQLVCATNALPTSEDKTDGLSRRLEWFPFAQKIDNDASRDPWFTRVKSNDAALMFLQMLAIRAVRIAKTGKLVECPEDIDNLAKMYRDANVNVKTWIESLGGVDNLKYKPVKQVYDDYLVWCETSAENPLGKRKFNSVFISETELVKKVTYINETHHPDIFKTWKDDTFQHPERLNAKHATLLLWCPAND